MKPYKVIFKKNKDGQWYWKIPSRNGNIIDRSTEPMVNRADIVHNARLTFLSLMANDEVNPKPLPEIM